MRKTLFLGGGNMAFAILGGLISQGASPEAFHVIEINPEAQDNMRQLQVACSPSWPKDFAADQVVLAVKPQVMQQVVSGYADHLGNTLLISIAAGVSIDQLSQWANNPQARVARAMPNTPALVGAGMTGLYLTSNCTADDQQAVQTIFSSCGQLQILEKEDDINLITAISGSGPGYVFYLMESLESAAVSLGFSAEQARLLVNQTFLGAATLASQSEDSLATLREKVTSKGGTTFAGLEALRAHKVDQAIQSAAQAAKTRAEEMQNSK